MKIHFEDIENIITETLESGKSFKISPNGGSMLPLIRQGIDSVYIKKPTEPLKKYDIIFFKRTDGAFVLHRIIKVKKDSYVLCGDNQWLAEHGIKRCSVIGVVCEIERDGVRFSCDDPKYMKYVKKRVNTRVIRNIKPIFIYNLKRVYHKICK